MCVSVGEKADNTGAMRDKGKVRGSRLKAEKSGRKVSSNACKITSQVRQEKKKKKHPSRELCITSYHNYVSRVDSMFEKNQSSSVGEREMLARGKKKTCALQSFMMIQKLQKATNMICISM